jgi:hypothetical protein
LTKLDQFHTISNGNINKINIFIWNKNYQLTPVGL